MKMSTAKRDFRKKLHPMRTVTTNKKINDSLLVAKCQCLVQIATIKELQQNFAREYTHIYTHTHHMFNECLLRIRLYKHCSQESF